MLTNEAYTGTAVWGRTTTGDKKPEPVRTEGAWEALVSRELFDEVQQGLQEHAPKKQRPARVGSKFLLSGLLRCGVCGKPYTGQGAKSGKFSYYVCGTLLHQGAGSCSARYLNAARVEAFIVERIREQILTDETITELIVLVAEDIDALASELGGQLQAVESELADIRSRLERLYEAPETTELTMQALSPRILKLRQREDQLAAAQEDAARQLRQRKEDLPTSAEIAEYVTGFRDFLEAGTFPERKTLIGKFVKSIEVVDGNARLTYTIPLPSDGVTKDETSVLDFVQSGPLFTAICY